jgi:hypothetical protein
MCCGAVEGEPISPIKPAAARIALAYACWAFFGFIFGFHWLAIAFCVARSGPERRIASFRAQNCLQSLLPPCTLPNPLPAPLSFQTLHRTLSGSCSPAAVARTSEEYLAAPER